MRRLLIALFITLLPACASAAEQCYNMEQLEAEQGLRIHSELMTIAINCQHLAGTMPLYKQYEDFTQRNLALITSYENTMRNFFASEGQVGETSLNTFRTVLANRIANEAVRLQPNVFCRAYKGRITQASSMSQPQFRKWAQTVFPGYPLTRKLCPGVTPLTQAAPKH
jgi:hypothetical protein